MSGARSVTVHLVRHGEVENPRGIIYGRLPGYHLSERGMNQARQVARHIADQSAVAGIWASPLERARETADTIAEELGLEVVIDDRLIESGSKFEGIGANLVAVIRSPRRWWHLRNPVRPSWGESFSDIRERMLAAISDALAAAGGSDVVVVSHQTPIVVARFALARRRVPPWLGFTPCQTGSVTTLALRGDVVERASYFAPSP